MFDFKKVFKSRTVWAIIIMFLVGGFKNISGFLSPEWMTFIMAALGLLATYFRVDQKVDFSS